MDILPRQPRKIVDLTPRIKNSLIIDEGGGAWLSPSSRSVVSSSSSAYELDIPEHSPAVIFELDAKGLPLYSTQKRRADAWPAEVAAPFPVPEPEPDPEPMPTGPSMEDIQQMVDNAVGKAYDAGYSAGWSQAEADLGEKYLNAEAVEKMLAAKVDAVISLVETHKADTGKGLSSLETMILKKTGDIVPTILSSVDDRMARLKEEQNASLMEATDSQLTGIQSSLVAEFSTLKKDLTDLIEATVSKKRSDLQAANERAMQATHASVEKAVSEETSRISQSLKDSLDKSYSAERHASEAKFQSLKSDFASVKNELTQLSINLEGVRDMQLKPPSPQVSSLNLQHSSMSTKGTTFRKEESSHSASSSSDNTKASAPSSMDSFVPDESLMHIADEGASEDGSLSEMSSSFSSDKRSIKALQQISSSSTNVGDAVLFLSRRVDRGEQSIAVVPGTVRRISRALALKVPKTAALHDLIDIDTARGFQRVPYSPGRKIKVGSLLLVIPASAAPGKSIIWEDVGEEGVPRYDVEITTEFGSNELVRTWAKHLRLPRQNHHQRSVRFAPS